MGKTRLHKAIGVSALTMATLLTGCSNAPESTKILPTTGEFTQEAEAFYLKRYEASVEAFKSGADTATYDTEVLLGQSLVRSDIERGAPKTSKAALSSMKEFAQKNNSSSLIIYENGKIVSEDYFGGVTSSTLMNAKSLAKPLGVIAMGRAIKAGYVKDLDQPVSDFLIEWKGTDKDAIKIRHILRMTSGLLRQNRAPTPQDVLNRAYLHPHHDEVIIHEYPLVDEPGSRYEYSNANSEIVAIIIERATGQKYQDWLAQQVLAPLGAEGGKIWLNRENGMAHSGCCAGLTSETYLRLAIMIAQEGEFDGKTILPKEFISEMTTPSLQNKYAGMGVYIGKEYKEYRGAANPDGPDFTAAFHSESYLDKDIVLFDGNANQVIYILPSRDTVIMRLGPRPKDKKGWDNAFLPNAYIRGLGQ